MREHAVCITVSMRRIAAAITDIYYGPWITEIILFQSCLPFVPPLSTVSIQIFNNFRKVEIVEEDKIFYVKIVENT
jgi:hypothetical protein